jgi:hypothetical protein
MVVKKLRAVLCAEIHAKGWLPTVGTRLAKAPLKRFVIEFPFVAAKAFPASRLAQRAT